MWGEMVERYTVRYRSTAPETAVLLVEDSNGYGYVYSKRGLQIRADRPDGCAWLRSFLGGPEHWVSVAENVLQPCRALHQFLACGEQ